MTHGEFDLIARHFHRPSPRAVLGVGDDCALLAPTPGMELALSTDLLVEGRHFIAAHPPARLGHKALAVNLSDLAACGATPRAYLLSLALPSADDAFLTPFAQGLHALADAHDIELVGGDTTAGPLTIGITVLGEVPAGQALRRSGARAGDDIWVSGTPGLARLGLESLLRGASLRQEDDAAARLALEAPTPRVALGLALRGLASAAIDLSDGLLGDLGHVLAASGVGAEIDADAIPLHPALAAQPLALRRLCQLAGGDDYELLFTATPGQAAAVQALGGVARIGRITAAPGLVVRDGAGAPLDTSAWRSFDHFK